MNEKLREEASKEARVLLAQLDAMGKRGQTAGRVHLVADALISFAAAEQGHAADAHTSEIVTYCKDCCGKEVHAATCKFARG